MTGDDAVTVPQRERASVPATAANGAASGLAATVAMTVVFLTARRLGLVDEPPPEAVVTGFLEQVNLDDTVEPPERTALVSVAHLGYGALFGALFSLSVRGLGGPSVPRGSWFGLALWAFSYMGWLPATGILPPPSRQGAGRHVENVLGHLTYGATLGGISRRLGRYGTTAASSGAER